MKHFLKTYFSFSRREQPGLLVLVLLIVAVFVMPAAINKFSEQKVWDYTEYIGQIEAFEKALQDEETARIKANEDAKITYFNFDPNTASKKQLLSLGFTNKQAGTLLKYRKAGGTFYKPSDLKKVYGVSTSFYKKLNPYIVIKQQSKPKSNLVANTKPSKYKYKKKIKTDSALVASSISIEINAADSVDLIRFNGIGVSYARRIITYRKFLGGFHSLNQLYEVYGLPKETVESLFSQMTIDSLRVTKININSAIFKTINRHPYISYKQTKHLLKYRELMGEFESVNAVLDNHLMDTLTFEKVRPYLSIE